MGFKRMGCDASLITPNLMQQHIARDNGITRVQQEFENGRFLLRQPYLAVAIRLQKLAAGVERIGPDAEDRIV